MRLRRGLPALLVLAAVSWPAAALGQTSGATPVPGPDGTPSGWELRFALPTGGWTQVAGPTPGTVQPGSYGRPLRSVVPGCGRCRARLDVTVRLRDNAPRVVGRTVRLNPGARYDTKIPFDRWGTVGAVRWFTSADGRGAGFRRAPRAVDPSGKAWIVFTVGGGINRRAGLSPATRALLGVAIRTATRSIALHRAGIPID